ncbi:oligosaccharide flippase family protein [Ekhidna sp. To15]|uniref:oligosaccharide flippase family protein n=1 Tax=Ekhidna sp. To15 TaxID=3395267 RepID=UPI003F5245E2
MSYRKQLLKGGISGGLASGMGQVGSVFLRFYLSRLLGPAGVGLYEVGISIIRISSAISQGGVSQIMVKFLAQEEDKDLRNQFVRAGLFAVLLFSIFISTSLIIGKDFLNSELLKSDSDLIFWVIIAAVPLWSMNQYFALSLRGINRIGESIAIQAGLFPYLLMCAILIFSFDRLSLNNLFLSVLICLLIINIIGGIFLKLRASLKVEKVKEFYRRLFSRSFPVWLVSIARILSLRLDKVILALYVSTDQVGIYSIGFILASLLQFVPGFISPVSQPLLAKYLNDKNQTQKLYQDLILFTTILMLPALMFLVVNGEYILSLFGKDFEYGYTVMIVLSIGFFFNGFVGPTGNIMIMGDQQKKLAIIQYVTLALFVFLSLIIVPHYGILGAAICRSLIWICAEFAKLILINRIYGLVPFRVFELKKLLLATFIFLMLVVTLRGLENDFLKIILFFIGWGLIYWLIYRNNLKRIFALILKKIS